MALEDFIDYPEFAPVEDLFLGLLKPLEGLVPGLKVRTIIESEKTFTTPYVVVRRVPDAFANTGFGDDRFTQRAVVSVQVFCKDPNGDEKGARLSEIIRRFLVTAWLRGQVVVQSGSMSQLVVLAPPYRADDWTPSTSATQGATLPQGVSRYETEYGVVLRPANDAGDPLALFA